MIEYRTHTCGELRTANAGQKVKLSGWIHRKRNLGNLCFVDLRDHYGITQCVVDSSSDLIKKLEDIREEIAMADVPEYKEIRLSMSVGGVYGSCKVRDGVMEADRLLYQAKRQKNCVAYKRI